MRFSSFAARPGVLLSKVRSGAIGVGKHAIGTLGVLGNAAMVGSFVVPSADIRQQKKIVSKQEELLQKQEELAKQGVITTAVLPDDRNQPPKLSPNSLRNAFPPEYDYL